MKVMCNQCGRVLHLMTAQAIALEEEGRLKSFYFCSQEHLSQYLKRTGMKLGKN
jgi:hypothetical protein